MTRVLACIALLIFFVQPAWAQDAAETRIALVIGNSQYQSDRIPDLRNPVNDAEDIARALRGYGFSVDLRLDLDKVGMTEAMESFAASARTADVALFYYAGHGMQVDLRNYLSPVDAEYTSHDDVINRSVPLDALTEATLDVEGSLLIFIDACQENPAGGRDGLARIPVSRNQFVALAALPDSLAADGAGRNSPFSGAFLTNSAVPGRNISDVMLAVRQDVIATTGSQVPWDNSSLTREIVFVPGDEPALSPETQLWRLASSMNAPNLARDYLERFPEGQHVAEATELLVKLSEGGVPTGADPEVRSLEVEDNLWQLASSSRWRPLLETYLERYPEGAHAVEARELVDVLSDPTDPTQAAAYNCERLATHPNDATAAFAGVPSGRLHLNAGEAVAACQEAHASFPDLHKYTAMLARSLFLGGNAEEGTELFREAAAAGNIRALTTLGAFYEKGTGVEQDLARARDYYQQAAKAGASDAAVNLARMLMAQVPPEIDEAISLLTTASDAGSKEAAFNLGVLAINEIGLPGAEAQQYFALASDRGYPDGHFSAAALFETDRYGGRDPQRAAEYLLRAIASDSGKTLQQVEGMQVEFGKDTIGTVQERLKELRLFTGTVDGQLGPRTFEALRAYRFGGIGGIGMPG